MEASMRQDNLSNSSATTHVTLWMRRGRPAPRLAAVPGELGVSHEAHRICLATQREYDELRKRLQHDFEYATYHSAPDFRSVTSMAVTFRPPGCVMQAELDEPVNLQNVNKGAWLSQLQAEHLPYSEQLNEAWEARQRLLPSLNNQLAKVDRFFFDHELLSKTRFRICVGAESLISMFVAKHDDPPEDKPFVRLGLKSSQSFLIFHNKNRVLRVSRFDPAGTERHLAVQNSQQAVAQ